MYLIMGVNDGDKPRREETDCVKDAKLKFECFFAKLLGY